MALPTIWQDGSSNIAAAAVPGFTKDYNCHRLVWCEFFESIHDARQFEVRMKKWNRSWKVKRIVERNPEWIDLFEQGLIL